jgi:hypothetical protein
MPKSVWCHSRCFPNSAGLGIRNGVFIPQTGKLVDVGPERILTDQVYRPATQVEVYEEIDPLIGCVLDACLLVYGQTEPGKTFMTGTNTHPAIVP